MQMAIRNVGEQRFNSAPGYNFSRALVSPKLTEVLDNPGLQADAAVRKEAVGLRTSASFLLT